MTTPNVAVDHYAVRIHFGDLLHAHFKRSEYLGLQSWTDGPHDYSIEVTLTGGSITLEYESAENWRAVLTALDKVL